MGYIGALRIYSTILMPESHMWTSLQGFNLDFQRLSMRAVTGAILRFIPAGASSIAFNTPMRLSNTAQSAGALLTSPTRQRLAISCP